MASQGDMIMFRAARITSAPFTTPIDGVAGTAPTFGMSPTGTAGLPTGGFLWFLKKPAAGGADDTVGLNVQIALRDPNTFRWGVTYAASVGAYGELWRSTDINAMDAVEFQIDAPAGQGLVDVHFAEVQAA